jgi:GTP pyrophosphokinase
LFALRIIVNQTADCYTLVGLVHGLWKPLDGRFKDYIAVPKANGYQSLHTAVLFEGKPLEIQIRTEAMHQVAEHGVASHWLYKQKTTGGAAAVNPTIIDRLKELKTEHLQDTEFFNEMRGELLGDSIFVFTPKDDVIELPAGATAIDFAYAIHSGVGEKIVGAKANGQIIPLAAALKNTQIIEVLTNPQAHPTVNQLKLVRSAKARSKIRSWLLQNDPTFADNPAVKTPEKDAPPQQPHRHEHKSAAALGDNQGVHGEAKVCIGNTTNFMVTLARCCNPVFGDEITGYVSRGRGVIVHRSDCRVFRRIPNVEAQSIDASWE